MTVSSIATGYDGISLLAGNAAYDPAGTFLIQRTAGTGSSGTITFSSIPQNYKHLQIRCIANDGNTNNLRLRFNSDTGSNYAYHFIFGDASPISVGSATSATYIDYMGKAVSTASTYGASIIDIHDYSSTTKNKTVRGFWGYDTNGAGWCALASGLWMNTSAITSISIIDPAANFTTASTFALYGMVG